MGDSKKEKPESERAGEGGGMGERSARRARRSLMETPPGERDGVAGLGEDVRLEGRGAGRRSAGEANGSIAGVWNGRAR
jgi:hypothetical protein